MKNKGYAKFGTGGEGGGGQIRCIVGNVQVAFGVLIKFSAMLS